MTESVHDIRSFLGLTNHFQKFIEHYAEIALPPTDLARKSRRWDWIACCQDASELLKQELTEALLLRTPNEQLPYDVETDASDLGLGAVLLQEGHPVDFESRKLNSAKLYYLTTEKDMLVVVHARRVWRCYLKGADFMVYSERRVKHLFSICNQTRRDGEHASQSFCSALGLSNGSTAKS
jgi:hypothetical protein